jgi:rubrerythrin
VLEEEVKEKDCPHESYKSNSFACSSCSKIFTKRFNLNKHIKNMHSGVEKKYLKHIKKDGKFLCKVCGKLFARSLNLKLHYSKDHTKTELKEKQVPVKPIVNFARKKV